MLIDASGRHLHVEVTGAGDPTVVFVAAWSEPGRNWGKVQQLLGDVPRQVVYDRAGIGASPPRPDWDTPHPYSALASELAGVMDAVGVDKPVVLAGHSFGSLIVRAFTACWPDWVAGLVHVDGSVPELKLLPSEDFCSWDGDRLQATRIDLDAGEAEIRSAPPPPTVPAVVLSRTPGRWVDPRYLPVDGYWTRCQAELAESLNAVHVVADDAGHRLQEESPGLVAYAIERVLHAARVGEHLNLAPEALADRGGHITQP